MQGRGERLKWGVFAFLSLYFRGGGICVLGTTLEFFGVCRRARFRALLRILQDVQGKVSAVEENWAYGEERGAPESPTVASRGKLIFKGKELMEMGNSAFQSSSKNR